MDASGLDYANFYPEFGENHDGTDPELLLNTTRVLVGFGQPMEDYLPLEAL